MDGRERRRKGGRERKGEEMRWREGEDGREEVGRAQKGWVILLARAKHPRRGQMHL